jgi:hypothetical protein
MFEKTTSTDCIFADCNFAAAEELSSDLRDDPGGDKTRPRCFRDSRLALLRHQSWPPLKKRFLIRSTKKLKVFSEIKPKFFNHLVA